jgi:hypothetical protein|nr:MAG TPA: hypothetical protein [Crassvirales sp.]
MKIYNADSKIASLQVSRLGSVEAGDTEFGITVLLKNITEEPVTCQILPAGQTEYISTVLSVGWNPELVIGVKGAPADSLQYGY